MNCDDFLENIWKFIRSDSAVDEFEEWVYSDITLENAFGKSLYLNIISTDYTSKEAVFKIKQLLKEFVSSSFIQKCHCFELSDIAVIDMGEDSEKVFKTLSKVREKGGDYWWLSVCRCFVCNQIWLVAAEERQNDLYCLKRMDESTLSNIITNNQWPTIFNKYETLLRIGFEAGRSVRFIEPHESSLQWTITNLAKDRPGIHVSEIAQLLNLNLELATSLSIRAKNNDNVQINFT